MIRKSTLYRRKFKGSIKAVFLSVPLCLLVFGGCFAVWLFVHNQFSIKSPLGKNMASKNSYALSGQIQMYCSQYHINCTSIAFNADNTATVLIDAEGQVLFSLKKDLRAQFASLQLAEHHLTIEGKRFSRIDFRFDKPIITY